MITNFHPQYATAMLGPAVHLVFNRYEPRHGGVLLFLTAGIPCLISAILFIYGGVHPTFFAFFKTVWIFLTSLTLSVVAYRVSPFHPLAQYPGPVFLRISRLFALYIMLSGKQQLYYHELHRVYGPYLRTGPNHIHISDAAAIPVVLGSRKFIKGARYDAVKRSKGTASILGLSDPQEHAVRRKFWDRALNGAALKSYSEPLNDRVSQLVSALGEAANGPVLDLAMWLSFFSFDFMGDLAYGGIFHVMEEKKDTVGIMHLSALAPLTHEAAGTIPWIRPFYNLLPLPAKTSRHLEFAKNTILQRKAVGSPRRDLFSHLTGEDGLEDPGLTLPTLISETSFAIVAGSDTTAVSMASMFYYLLSHRNVYKRLQQEIDIHLLGGTHSESQSGDPFDPTALAQLPYLNAVINEALRMQPLVPNGVQRIPVSNTGEFLNGRWIPSGTVVQVSTHSVHRDPANFSPSPDEFIPERWLSPEERDLNLGQVTLRTEAYFPFSHGYSACAGKNLALVEMRVVTVHLMQQFEMQFKEGWNSSEWEESLKDFYTLQKGRLPIVIQSRRG